MMRKEKRLMILFAALALVLGPVGVNTALAFDIGEQVDESIRKLNIYGYFGVRYEKTFQEPGLENGRTVYEDAPGEWAFPNFSLMVQNQISKYFKAYINLNGNDYDTVTVRNAWGEFTPVNWFSLRGGKIYRKFGLYNEILDAVPTYIGIEPPELFDSDHLLISRTTIMMLSGNVPVGPGAFSYSLSTDNGEGDPFKETFPIAWDFRYLFGNDRYTLGTSGYYSGGETNSDVAVGDGSPKSGVLPWMEFDKFWIVGGFLQAMVGNLTLQMEYWHANHDARRNPADVVTIVNDAGINPAQQARFLIDPNGAVDEANVNTDGSYEVDTAYVRSGYSFMTRAGELVPYLQYDWYANKEVIGDKTYGGDNEAGVSDDGQFHKGTLGIVYRPIPQVAVKLDSSVHIYKFNGKTVNYPEVRLDISYIFGM